MIALFLVVSPKNDHAKKSWKLWCAGFFTCSAAVGIIFKLHQRSGSASKINEMMFAAALTSALLFTAMSFAVSEKRRPKPIPGSAVGYLVACGIAGCVYNRLNIFLAGQLPSVVFYPTFNGSVILISTLCGLIFFKEKLKAQQAIGIAAGAAALMLASGTIDRSFENHFQEDKSMNNSKLVASTMTFRTFTLEKALEKLAGGRIRARSNSARSATGCRTSTSRTRPTSR